MKIGPVVREEDIIPGKCDDIYAAMAKLKRGEMLTVDASNQEEKRHTYQAVRAHAIRDGLALNYRSNGLRMWFGYSPVS